MTIEIEFAELHNPLFLAGTNLQLKLEPAKRTGLKLEYDRAEKELLVTYNGKTAIVPTTNVSSMTPATKPVVIAVPSQQAAANMSDPERDKIVAAQQAAGKQPRVTAQVSGPHDHVFAGPGHGKSK